jgi:hypothetical protein
MGRRPIGKVAMTAAERVARYRRQHVWDKPDYELQAELACLRVKPRSRNKALKAFGKTLEHIFHSNDLPTEVQIPQLNDEQRAAALRCVNLSIRMLQQFSKRIGRESAG